MSETALGAATEIWQADGHALKVEYSLAVIAEVRSAVLDGYHQLGHGGLEVGGVLFGKCGGDTVRILGWKPIACRHAQGPSFSLDAEDEEELCRLLSDSGAAPELAGLIPVGWFRSNTRRAISLSENDIALFNRFFPEPRQIAMVLRPVRGGATRAGFFFREEDGAIRRENSYREFEIEAVSARYVTAAGPEAGRTEAKTRLPNGVRDGAAVEPPPFLSARPPKRPPVWWTFLVVVACGLAGLGGAWLDSVLFRTPDQPLVLRVHEAEGQLHVEWGRTARAVANAESGKLVVQDGAAETEIALDRLALARGQVTYARRSEQVKISLILLRKGASPVEEIAYFVGVPGDTKSAEELVELKGKYRELERENQRVQDDFRREGARADRLQQQYYKLLQERLRETTARGQRAGNQ